MSSFCHFSFSALGMTNEFAAAMVRELMSKVRQVPVRNFAQQTVMCAENVLHDLPIGKRDVDFGKFV